MSTSKQIGGVDLESVRFQNPVPHWRIKVVATGYTYESGVFRGCRSEKEVWAEVEHIARLRGDSWKSECLTAHLSIMDMNKKPTHTPGPWKWVAIDGGWDGVKQENGSLICKLVLNEPENARLIAAAPELLDELRNVSRWAASCNAKQYTGLEVLPEDWSELDQATNKAKAAIAKATSQTP